MLALAVVVHNMFHLADHFNSKTKNVDQQKSKQLLRLF